MGAPLKPETRIARFNAQIKRVPETGCWEWTGQRQPSGYGRMMRSVQGSQKVIYAHRFSYELHNGPISHGMHVCHRCDNPPCVNPAHLFLGTHKDNVADMYAKGRQNHTSKVTAQDVVKIRELIEVGETYSALASRYGVDVGTISDIKRRRSWANL